MFDDFGKVLALALQVIVGWLSLVMVGRESLHSSSRTWKNAPQGLSALAGNGIDLTMLEWLQLGGMAADRNPRFGGNSLQAAACRVATTAIPCSAERQRQTLSPSRLTPSPF